MHMTEIAENFFLARIEIYNETNIHGDLFTNMLCYQKQAYPIHTTYFRIFPLYPQKYLHNINTQYVCKMLK